MTLSAHNPGIPHRLVFFDGVCGLCNHFVDWLIAHDKQQTFRYAPLQGSTARSLLGQIDTVTPKSVVLWHDGVTCDKAAAVAQILQLLGGRWQIIGRGMALLPVAVANAGYDLVASYRYRIFGKRDACRLPTVAERALFFD